MGLPGDGGFIDTGRSAHHGPVHGNPRSRPDDHDVSGPHVWKRQLDLNPVLFHESVLWGQRQQIPQCPTALFAREPLRVVAHPHERHHDERHRPAAADQRGHGTQSHQCA